MVYRGVLGESGGEDWRWMAMDFIGIQRVFFGGFVGCSFWGLWIFVFFLTFIRGVYSGLSNKFGFGR